MRDWTTVAWIDITDETGATTRFCSAAVAVHAGVWFVMTSYFHPATDVAVLDETHATYALATAAAKRWLDSVEIRLVGCEN